MFKSELLKEIDATVPASPLKMKQVMLFALLDNLANSTPEDFIADVGLLLQNNQG